MKKKLQWWSSKRISSSCSSPKVFSTCLSFEIGSTRFLTIVKCCPVRSIFFSLNLMSILFTPIRGSIPLSSDTRVGVNSSSPLLIWGRWVVFSREMILRVDIETLSHKHFTHSTDLDDKGKSPCFPIFYTSPGYKVWEITTQHCIPVGFELKIATKQLVYGPSYTTLILLFHPNSHCVSTKLKKTLTIKYVYLAFKINGTVLIEKKI